MLSVLLASCGNGSKRPKGPGVIVFESRRSGGEYDPPDLYAMNPDGSALHRLTRGASWPDFSVSSDGRRVAYSADGWIWIVRIDGTGRHRFVHGRYPAWSPNSQHLAVVTGRLRSDDGFGNAAVVYSLVGRRERTVFRGQLSTPPTWSPDGKQVALIVGNGSPEGRLVVVDEDGRARTIARAEDENAAAWSPEGRLIAYVRDIWLLVVAPDGSHRRRLGRSFGLFARGLPMDASSLTTTTSREASTGSSLPPGTAGASGTSRLRLASSFAEAMPTPARGRQTARASRTRSTGRCTEGPRVPTSSSPEPTGVMPCA